MTTAINVKERVFWWGIGFRGGGGFDFGLTLLCLIRVGA